MVSSLFPVKNERPFMPPLAAALGMAFSFYSYPLSRDFSPGVYLPATVVLVLVIVIGVFRALSALPGKKTPGVIKTGILAAAGAAGFVLGIAAARSVPGPAETGISPERIIAVSGVLREDPRTLRGGSGFGSLELNECAAAGGLRASARGSVAVFFPAGAIPRLKEFGRGCEIYAEGEIVPERGNTGRRELLFRAVSVHITRPASPLEQFRTGLRMTLLERFQRRQESSYSSGDAPLWGNLASALLLGVRDNLDTELSESFRNSGCAHVLALSGMHLAVLSGILAFLLRKPLGVRGASLAGAVFIVFYVFIAGSQSSLVRAAIMYLLGTFALWNLLKGKPLSLLCAAFIIQLVLQSGAGMSLSFILSYLALGGILTLGESLAVLFRGRLPDIVGGGLAASLGAFVFTAPVTAYFFTALRPIGIIAGIFIAPLSSLFMVLSLGALVSGFIPLPLWDALDFVLTWFYRLIELLVSLAARVPGFEVSNPLPVLCFSVLFSLLVFFLRGYDNVKRNSVAAFD